MRWLWWTLGAIAVAVLLVVSVGAMLPQDHEVSRTVLLTAPPERVWAMITDVGRYPTWRRGVTSVTIEPTTTGGPIRWREHTGSESLGYEMNASARPTRVVTRITDEGIPFGGGWTFELAPAGEGTSLTITERGSVYNPLFRFVSRFVMGHTKTIDEYAADLVLALSNGGGKPNG
jgi:uncharacterized protein YndB with AHSA1/START domain